MFIKTQKNACVLAIFPCLFLMVSGFGAYAVTLDLSTAIQNAKIACSGISDSMDDMKTKAGINTAVTSVGTVTGGVALGAGGAKAGVDDEQHALEEKVKKLIDEKSKVPLEKLEIENEAEFEAEILRVIAGNYSEFRDDLKKINELEQKSKTLGNVRTGTLAVSTATNIAGTAIAATNKVSGDLKENINKCIESVKILSDAKLAAKVENTATESELATADKIINACRDYEQVDLRPINKRATSAAVSSGIGAGTGFVGTITSAVANKDKVRDDEGKKEANLNTASNVMAGVTTAASATATIFNASQIAAIKKVVRVADICEGALK